MKIDRIALPSAEELNGLLAYNPKTGALIWRARPSTSRVNKNFNARFSGKQAGTIESWGYRQLKVYGKLHMAHRVIWKIMTGEEPTEFIDHKDGNPSNNRWANLREADLLSNNWNRKKNANNTVGYRCIYPLKTKRPTSKKFRVTLRFDGKKNLIGDFHTIEEANAAYEAAFARYRDVSFKR
jgi:hypothetical protein